MPNTLSPREKKNARQRNYYRKHRDKILAAQREKRDYKVSGEKKLRRERRASVLALLGGKCVHCGFSNFRALQIDHINGGGRKEKKKRNNSNVLYYYKHILDVHGEGYQILCSNCNWIKRYENNEGYRILN